MRPLVALFLLGVSAAGTGSPLLAQSAPLADPSDVAGTSRSGSYRLGGSRSIRPSLIWDDGRKTFLDWPHGVEAPAIFALDGAGKETLVNSHYRDGRFVIDAVYTRLLFRLDKLTAAADRRVDGMEGGR